MRLSPETQLDSFQKTIPLFSNTFCVFTIFGRNQAPTEPTIAKIIKPFPKSPGLSPLSALLKLLIIKNAKKYLNDNGKIFIEIGHNRDVVDEVFKDLNLWWVDTESGSDYIFMLEKNDLP